MNRKLFILDTSVLLYDKESIHSLPGNNIVLPLVVLEELDRFKERRDGIGEAARYVNRFLDDIRTIKVDDDGWRCIEKHDMKLKFAINNLKAHVPEGFDVSRNDNIIIGCAKYLQQKFPERNVKLITKDINLRVKCDAVGIHAEDYYKDHLEKDEENFLGHRDVVVDDSAVDSFYDEGSIKTNEDLEENAFIIGKSGDQKGFLGIHKKGVIKKLSHEMNGFITVDPRNSEQKFAIEALLDPKIPLVTLTGLAGSGKTFLTIMAGLAGIKGGNAGCSSSGPEAFYERLIMTRTLQPVGRDLGYLPGALDEKMAPWLMPILDNVRHAFKDISYFQQMMKKGDVEVAPIPYIRGRTFNNSFLIVDEAQNATIHELKTIITRMGQGSKLVLLGDIDQIDTPYIDRQSNGLSIVISKFKSSPMAAHINLSKGQRSDLASIASSIL